MKMFMFVPISGYVTDDPIRFKASELEGVGFRPDDIEKLNALEVGQSVYMPDGTTDCTMVRLHDEP